MLKVKPSRSRNYILGAFLTLFSVSTLINKEFIFGSLSLLLALAIFTTYNYIAFDFAASYQGAFTCLFSIIPLGGWKRLPVISHVVVKRFSEIVKDEISDSGVIQSIRNQRYIIMFSVPNSNKGIIIMELASINNARRTAQDIAAAGGFELRDYTS